MSMDFSSGAGQQTGNDLIPNGQLAWAIMTVRAVKGSSAGGQYLDVELVVDDGQPFARRKIWDMIGDPLFAGNSEQYRQMGQVSIARILESGRGAGPANVAAYHLNRYEDLSGLRVAVKLKIEKGTGGFEDKNKVAEYLTPNPASGSGHKNFLKLQAGEFNTAPAAAARPAANAGGFGAPAANGGESKASSFGQNTTAGFGQPAGQGTQSGNARPAADPSTASGFAGPATNRPSEPAAGGWLAQANGQAG